MEKNADANPLPADLRFARARELEFVLWTVHQHHDYARTKKEYAFPTPPSWTNSLIPQTRPR